MSKASIEAVAYGVADSPVPYIVPGPSNEALPTQQADTRLNPVSTALVHANSSTSLNCVNASSPAQHVDAALAERETPRRLYEERDTSASLHRQIQNAKNAAKSLEEDKQALEDELNLLEDENLSLSQTNSMLNEDKSALEQELLSAKHELSNLRGRVTAVETENAILVTQGVTFEKDKSALVSEKTSLQDAKSALEKNKSVLEAEKEELHASWERMNNDVTRVRAAFTVQLDKDKARLKEIEALTLKVNATEEQVAVLDESKREVESCLEAARQEVTQKAKAIEELVGEIKQVESKLDDSAKKNASLSSENARLRGEKEALEQEIGPLQAQNNTLSEELSSHQARILVLETDETKLHTALQNAKTQLEKHEEAMYRLTMVHGKASADKDLARFELNKEKTARRSMMSDVRAARARIIELETELRVAIALMEDAHVVNVGLSQTERILKDRAVNLQNTIAHLTEEADRLRNAENDLAAEISSLQADISTQEAQKAKLRGQLVDAQRQLADAAERVSTLHTEVLVKGQSIDRMHHKFTEEQRLRINLQKDVRELRVTTKEFAAELESTENASNERIAEMERKASLAAHKVDDLTRQLSGTKMQVGELRRRLNDETSELRQWERRVVAEQERVRQVKEELREANRLVNELDPEKLYKQLVEEKAARVADIARLREEVLSRKESHAAEVARLWEEMSEKKAGWNAQLAKLKVKMATLEQALVSEKARHEDASTTLQEARNKLSEALKDMETKDSKIKALEAAAVHEDCVDRDQVKDLIRIFKDLFADYESGFTGSRFSWHCPDVLVRRNGDHKSEIRFVKKVFNKRRRLGW